MLDGAGEPVPDALVEVWHAGRAAFGPRRGDAPTAGGSRSSTVKPARAGRGAGAAPRGGVFARGLLKQVVTRMYFPDEAEANAADPVLVGARPERGRATLVAVPDGRRRCGSTSGCRATGETVFFAL